MSKDTTKLKRAFRGLSEPSRSKLKAAMENESESDWFAELVKRRDRPEELAELKPIDLARRLVALAG